MDFRYVSVKNAGTTTLDIYVFSRVGVYSRNVHSKLGTLLPQHTIKWKIPDDHWAGHFRVSESQNATLAEFTFNGFSSQTGIPEDTYSICAVPPQSPKTCKNYSECVKHTKRTGFNVPVKIYQTKKTLKDNNKGELLLGSEISCRRAGDGKYARVYPNDTGKIRISPQEISNYQIEFGKPNITNYNGGSKIRLR